MAGCYAVVHIPEKMLEAARSSVRAGRIFTLHVELNFNPDEMTVDENDLSEAERIELHDRQDKPAENIAVPTAEIERITRMRPVVAEEIASAQTRRTK